MITKIPKDCQVFHSFTKVVGETKCHPTPIIKSVGKNFAIALMLAADVDVCTVCIRRDIYIVRGYVQL